MSADRLGEGCSEEIRTINEFRVVTIPGDAIIVGSPLILAGPGVIQFSFSEFKSFKRSVWNIRRKK